MSDFHTAYPEYASTSRLDRLRDTEYCYLDSGGHTYLDYTGAGLAADAQLRAHVQRLRGGCFGNPHSENPTSSASTRLIEEARSAVGRYFNAAADEYAVDLHPERHRRVPPGRRVVPVPAAFALRAHRGRSPIP